MRPFPARSQARSPARSSCLVTALLAATAAPVLAQTAPRAPEPVVVPQVERREVRAPSYPSRDFAIGLFGGTYGTQNFGASGVGGVRLGYHITEDFFVDATLAQTKVTDEAFRQVLPGGLFGTPTQTLRYYAVSAGWNVLTGEAFFGRRGRQDRGGALTAGAINAERARVGRPLATVTKAAVAVLSAAGAAGQASLALLATGVCGRDRRPQRVP